MPFSPRPFFFLPLEEEGSEVAFPPLESWDSSQNIEFVKKDST